MSRRSPLTLGARVLLLSLGGGLLALLVAMQSILRWPEPAALRWSTILLLVIPWIVAALMVRGEIERPLRTLGNMLAALREGDYSIRLPRVDRRDAFAQAIQEINALGETLKNQRLGALEATALLRRVMEEIEVAIFAFDSRDLLRLVNREGERILALPAERLLGASAEALGLDACLKRDDTRPVELAFAGRAGRFEVRRRSFRQGGEPHQLLVISDLSRALREEERQAFQRMVRVLGHEIGNSLAPIKSLAGSLASLLAEMPPPTDRDADLVQGLAVIETRADGLARFMSAYAKLARLPEPRLGPVDVADWVRRVAALETRRAVRIVPGPSIDLRADRDQLDALLINLVRNAVDATTESGGVSVTWKRSGTFAEILVDDEGIGLPESANLFTPFFTTKPGGQGIGLALSRQIVDAHGGTLTLTPREPRGARARLLLPIHG